MLELVYILQAFTSHVLNANKVVALLKKILFMFKSFI